MSKDYSGSQAEGDSWMLLLLKSILGKKWIALSALVIVCIAFTGKWCEQSGKNPEESKKGDLRYCKYVLGGMIEGYRVI